MGEIIETRKQNHYYNIFNDKLVRFCESTEQGAVLMKSENKDGKIKEKWAVPIAGLTGHFSEVSYKKEEKAINGKNIIFRSVVVKITENGETCTLELPLDSYGIDFIKRCMTIVKQNKGNSEYVLKLFAIKKDGKEYSNKYAIPYEDGVVSIPSCYSEENPEPKEFAWVKGTDIDGKVTWNKNANLKHYVSLLEGTVTPYFKKIEDARKQVEDIPESLNHPDDDIF